MKLQDKVCAVGLYRYGIDQPQSEQFRAFHDWFVNLLRQCGVTPTYVGAQGEGYSERLTKFEGRAHKRLIKAQFAGIHEVTLVANPPESDAPAFDHFAYMSFGYFDQTQELLLCVVLDEAIIALQTPAYDALIASLIGLHRWSFGYGFSDEVANQPLTWILGADNRRLSPEDHKLLCAWYEAPPEVRETHLRDVFPDNFLNEQQLHQEVAAGQCLKEFIDQHPGCTLSPLGDSGLYRWTVSDDVTLEQIRKQLRALPIVVH